MIAAGLDEIRADLTRYLDLAAGGEPVVIPRDRDRNVVVISEAEFDALRKAKRNVEYLAMLEESDRQLREGKVIRKTFAELEAMADE